MGVWVAVGEGVSVGVTVGVEVGGGVGVSGMTNLVAARQAKVEKSRAANQRNLDDVLPVIIPESSTGKGIVNLAFCIQD